MSTHLSIHQWADYLNRKTLGFNCPICGQNKWQTQPDQDGNVGDVEILDHAFKDELTSIEAVGTFDAVLKQEKPPVPRPVREPSLLKSVVVIRCGHCGWVGLFDKAFVEKHLND